MFIIFTCFCNLETHLKYNSTFQIRYLLLCYRYKSDGEADAR